MSELFSGEWKVEVIAKNPANDERFIIQGSLGSDGIYPGVVGIPPVSVAGPNWFIRFEWNNNAGSGWRESDVKKIDAESSLQDGLVITLGIDDNFLTLRDHDFDDLIVRCTNVEPPLNPWLPFVNKYDFTRPRDGAQRGGGGQGTPPSTKPIKGR